MVGWGDDVGWLVVSGEGVTRIHFGGIGVTWGGLG